MAKAHHGLHTHSDTIQVVSAGLATGVPPTASAGPTYGPHATPCSSGAYTDHPCIFMRRTDNALWQTHSGAVGTYLAYATAASGDYKAAGRGPPQNIPHSLLHGLHQKH